MIYFQLIFVHCVRLKSILFFQFFGLFLFEIAKIYRAMLNIMCEVVTRYLCLFPSSTKNSIFYY